MKRVISMCMVCLLFFASATTIVKAQESHELLRRVQAEPDGMCHCGAQREKVIKLRVRSGECEEHGVGTCVFSEERYYCYCTNPNCGDNWYTEWKTYKVGHNVWEK